MKAIIKNQIRLAIVIIIAFSFIGPATVSAEETLLLASIDRSAPADELHNYDFFPNTIAKPKKKKPREKKEPWKVL